MLALFTATPGGVRHYAPNLTLVNLILGRRSKERRRILQSTFGRKILLKLSVVLSAAVTQESSELATAERSVSGAVHGAPYIGKVRRYSSKGS